MTRILETVTKIWNYLKTEKRTPACLDDPEETVLEVMDGPASTLEELMVYDGRVREDKKFRCELVIIFINYYQRYILRHILIDYTSYFT